MALLFFCFACNKSDSYNPPRFDETFQVHFNLDGKNYSHVLPKGALDTGYGYLNEVSPGNYYFADGSIYQLTPNTKFHILLGTGNGPVQSNWPLAYESFKNMLSAGPKTYDSLEYCFQPQSNRVEIVYTDENGDDWSSTKWTYVPGGQIFKQIEQAGSSFIITEYKEVSLSRTRKDAAIIKAPSIAPFIKITLQKRKY